MFSHSLFKSIWLLMVVLLVMLGNAIPFPLLFSLSFIALALPLFREFKRRSDLDERQVQISHFSSHIAYFIFLILLMLILINEWIIKGKSPETIWLILLFVPIGLKVITCFFQNYGSIKGLRGSMGIFFRGIIPINAPDERQKHIGDFSSHIAFYLYTVIVVFYILIRFIASNEHPGNIWYMLLIVPMLIKFYVSLFNNYGAAKGARMICFTITGIFLLFVLLSHGIGIETIIESGPFLLLLAIILLSYRSPKIAGLILLLLGTGLLLFFKGWQNFEIYLRILMYSIIPLPVLLSGTALLISNRIKNEEERKISKSDNNIQVP